MRDLAMAKLYAFDLHTHGQFFWNFRTEFEPRWDFMQAVTRGWLPSRWDDADVSGGSTSSSVSVSSTRSQLRQEMTKNCYFPPNSSSSTESTVAVPVSLPDSDIIAAYVSAEEQERPPVVSTEPRDGWATTVLYLGVAGLVLTVALTVARKRNARVRSGYRVITEVLAPETKKNIELQTIAV